MAVFGEFLKNERLKKGLNQSEFGQIFGIIMTEISKMETGKKKFPFSKLEILANFIQKDYLEIKNLYVADRLMDEVNKYQCTDAVYAVAENQSKYLKSKV